VGCLGGWSCSRVGVDGKIPGRHLRSGNSDQRDEAGPQTIIRARVAEEARPIPMRADVAEGRGMRSFADPGTWLQRRLKDGFPSVWRRVFGLPRWGGNRSEPEVGRGVKGVAQDLGQG